VTTTPTVAIADFRLARPGSNVLGTFTLVIGGTFRLHGCRLVQSGSGGRFIGYPRVRHDDQDTWKPLTVPPADVTAQARDLASAAWKAATAARPVQGPPDDGYPF
jgi:hypothetical protein